jgi:spore coat protein A
MKKNSKSIDPSLNRRQLLKAGLVSGASLLLPWQLRLNPAFAGESPILEHFVDALPIPSVLAPTSTDGTTKYFEVQMAEIKQQLHRDLPETTVWGYGDPRDPMGTSFPGPTFEAYKGENIVVTWKNNLANDSKTPHYLKIDPMALKYIHGATNDRKAVVHLHGGHIPADVDGDPEATFLPGTEKVYDYPISQQAATLWYHDHSLGNTRLNVYMGLAGFFLVRDDNETFMIEESHLPAPEQHEIPLVLQDRIIKANGKLSYDAIFDDMFLGDVLLVNGKVWPYLDVERRKYRFRVLNGSNSRAYTLQLPGNEPFHQIGTDGGFLPHPVELTELTLTPGERADIVIDFSQFGGGDDVVDVVLMNTAPPLFGHPKEEKEKDIKDVLQFKVQPGEISNDIELLNNLVTGGKIQPISQDGAVIRDFKLDDFPDPDLGSKWLINGKGYNEITEKIEPGAVEIWNFINKSSHLHPMHLHLVQFQVLSRHKKVEGGYIDIGVDDNEMGWKDTVRVAGKEIVSVIAKFPEDKALFGNFPYHCHILEHEDHEMMRQFVLG